MMSKLIYLDHAAATPVDKKVLTAMQPYFSDNFYNPSSPYSPAVQVRRTYEEAKHVIASLLGVKPNEIIITAGATESINLAFSGDYAHVITTSIEHPAVLSASARFDRTVVEVDGKGNVSAKSIEKAIKPNTSLISIALANNELGTIQPIKEIAALVQDVRKKRLGIGNKTPLYLHTDASQGAGQIELSIPRLGVDMMTLNSGKMYGPKQVGLLYVGSHVRLQPVIVGGGQEQGMRSGTENVAGVIGFAKALELAFNHRKSEVSRLEQLRDTLETKLAKAFPEAVISGNVRNRLSGHLHISFPGLDAERLVFALEARGVLVATGSACAANKGTRSHVLTAIGLSPEIADGSLRLTLGHLNNSKNIERAAKIIIEEVNKEYARVNK